MFRQKSLSLIIIFSCFVGILPIQADNAAQKESFTTYVTNSYLNANFITEVKPTVVENTQEGTSFMKEFNKQLDSQRQILTKKEAQEAAFSIIAPLFSNPSSIIDASVIGKLELIGGGENATQHLFGILFGNKLHTALGKAHTAFTFCNPLTDVKILQKRQKAISNLADQPRNLQKLNSLFASIKKSETKSLTYWHSKPVIQERLMNALYFSMGPLKKLNTNAPSLEIINKFMTAGGLVIHALYWPASIGYIVHKIAIETKQSHSVLIRGAIDGLAEVLTAPETPISAKIGIGTSIIFFPIFTTFQTYLGVRNLQYITEGTYHLQEILASTANHIKHLQILSKFVNENKQLVRSLPSLKPLADFNNPKKHSAAFNKLISMLETNTFKGEPSFWSITGRVLAAHKLMQQVKDELAPVFAAAGELEMYVSLAQLYNERKGTNAEYCMAQFVESSTPVLEAQSFWNPFINPDVVVTNDVIFNSEHPNSIVTGPNTGGKSTILKAEMLMALMAQVFGMVPAKSLTLTPFTKLNCFMNIADDIATGASLFKSEVMRAKELSTMISSLKENEYSFVIIDEVFTGTSPLQGEEAALRFAQHLATFPNSISVIATHYPKMTTLEDITSGKFYNHHVEIIRNEDGSLNRTFKLKNGPTFFNVAFDILEEEGLVI